MAYNPNTIWISHTSLNDFERCKQLYYLRNLYRDKKYGNFFRIEVSSPFLTLGGTVHDAIDNFTTRYHGAERTKDNLMYEFKRGWSLKPGKIGGFRDDSQEKDFKARGEAMLERFFANKHFSQGRSIKIDFPKLALIAPDTAILVGNFDWLEESEDGLHILDFKTGVGEEDDNSLQLPIYALLAEHNLKKPVVKVSYWYLDRDSEPVEKSVSDLKKTLKELQTRAENVCRSVQNKELTCIELDGYCRSCHDYHKTVNDLAEHVQTDFKRKREVFFLPYN
jgi:hypothetical protein